MTICLSHRDYTDVICSFRMHDDHNFITQQADRDKALLTAIKTGVFEGKCEPLENTVSIGEVKVMLEQVGLPFFIVPSEFHIIAVYV